MDKLRKRVGLCLLLVVLVAVAVGVIYYYGETRNPVNITEGTLIARLGMKADQLFR